MRTWLTDNVHKVALSRKRNVGVSIWCCKNTVNDRGDAENGQGVSFSSRISSVISKISAPEIRRRRFSRYHEAKSRD